MKIGSLVTYVQFNAKDFNMVTPVKEKIYTVREFFPKGSIAAKTTHGIVFSSEDGFGLKK